MMMKDSITIDYTIKSRIRKLDFIPVCFPKKPFSVSQTYFSYAKHNFLIFSDFDPLKTIFALKKTWN